MTARSWDGTAARLGSDQCPEGLDAVVSEVLSEPPAFAGSMPAGLIPAQACCTPLNVSLLRKLSMVTLICFA